MDENSLLYSTSHEWVHQDDDIYTVGITKHAADLLTDITYVELPAVGSRVHQGASCGVIESVKSTSDLYAPVSGEVVAVNDALDADPSLINQEPFGKGWMFKLRVVGPASLGHLMDKGGYERQVGAE